MGETFVHAHKTPIFTVRESNVLDRLVMYPSESAMGCTGLIAR